MNAFLFDSPQSRLDNLPPKPQIAIDPKECSPMKRIFCALVLVIPCLIFFAQRTTRATSGPPSANGDFQFVLEDDNRRYLQFSAREDANNQGSMTFNDPTATPEGTTVP